MRMSGVPSVGDLRAIDHAIVTISKGLQQLLSVAPNLADLDESVKPQDSESEELLSSPRIQIAKELKIAYRAGKLPVVDHIISQDTFAAQKLKAQEIMDTVTAIPESREHGKESQTDNTGKSKKKNKLWPPPIPEIQSRRLRDQVFTHKSVANKRYYLSKEELLHNHNERLEFLGDAILNYTVSELVFRRFPNLPEGELTTIRSMLVCNDTLWEWATAYGLDKELRTEFDVYSDADGKRSKLIADVMEAYIGGLCLDSVDGHFKIREWLLELVDPFVEQIIEQRKAVKPLNPDAKSELYVRVGSQDRRPQYVTVVEGDNLHPFTVEVRMDGRTIGIGTGPNTKEAGLRAAMQALEDKETIQRLEEIRRQTPRAPNQTGNKDEKVKKRKASENEQVGSNKQQFISSDGNKKPVAYTGPKDKLYSLIGSADRRPNYVSRHINSKYYTKVFMQDDELGAGSGATKKEAEKAAAEMALQNTAKLEKWAQPK